MSLSTRFGSIGSVSPTGYGISMDGSSTAGLFAYEYRTGIETG
jgi:hypothetical protein